MNRFSSLSNLALILLILTLGLALQGCGGNANGQEANADDDADSEQTEQVADGEEGEEEEPTMIPVEASLVEVGDVTAKYHGTTSLEADQEAEVVAKVSGIVLEILVEEGDVVRKGQVLARLENDRQRSELAQAEANLLQLQNALKRADELNQKQLISPEDYDRAKFAAQAQQAAFDLAKLNMDWTIIRSPIDGVVSERMVKTGNLVGVHESLYRVTALSPLLAVMHVPERALATLALGQETQVMVDAWEGQSFAGQITRISPIVDADTGTFKVTAELSNEDSRLKPGMFGRVAVVYDSYNDVTVVPKEAILSEDGVDAVFVIEDQIVRRQELVTGYVNGAVVQVIAGVEPGQQVVVAGQGSLREGTHVEVIAEGS